METTKVWYITGASKGIGQSLATQLLARGQKVAVTSRNLSSLIKALGVHENLLCLEVDLTNDLSVAKSMRATQEKFGKIDVIVNNAGFGMGGALEELTSEEIDENFQVNMFGVIRVIQNAMPYLRSQRSGHIINISSIAGFAPGTGWSVYAAAKFAVSGLSEALANDLKPLGIHVTAVSPGWFRTSFAKPESVVYGKNHLPDYEYIRELHGKFNQMDGSQLGDPDKVADVLLKLTNHQNPPVNLFLGSDAFRRASQKIESLTAEMNAWKDISALTDFES